MRVGGGCLEDITMTFRCGRPRLWWPGWSSSKHPSSEHGIRNTTRERKVNHIWENCKSHQSSAILPFSPTTPPLWPLPTYPIRPSYLPIYLVQKPKPITHSVKTNSSGLLVQRCTQAVARAANQPASYALMSVHLLPSGALDWVCMLLSILGSRKVWMRYSIASLRYST